MGTARATGRGMPLLFATALAATLWDATPEHGDSPVLVVVTPGFEVEASLPLVHALRADGHDVGVLSFSCEEWDSAAVATEIAEHVTPDTVVVAHGLGATLALLAAPSSPAERYVLLAPVLDVWPVAATTWLAEQPPGLVVDLAEPLQWRDRDVREVLLGAPLPELTCMPAPLAAEVQHWLRKGQVPLDLEAVSSPVWIGVSAGDDVAALEAVVPASRRLPDRELVRLGINRLDKTDFSHAQMLGHQVPVRVAVRAAR